MRIISKFKDYYDNATKSFTYEIDPKLIYVRETKIENTIETTELNKQFIERLNLSKDFVDRWENKRAFLNSLRFIVIGFCGKLYHAYQLSEEWRYCTKKYMYNFDDFYNYFKTDGIFVNDYVKYLNSIPKNSAPKNIDLVVETERKKYTNQLDICNSYFTKTSKHKLIKSFDELDKLNGQTISDDMFIHYNSPVLYFSRHHLASIRLEINPNLSLYNFATKVDPFAAFQEISMYLGNNLAKQIDPTVNFTDEMKRDIAGFDNWSFKKQSKNSKI